MAPISSVRVATCVVAAALVGAAAATLPAEARAEDGPASASDTAVTMPAIDGSVLAGEASAAVEGALTDALGGSAQTEDPVSAAQATDPAPSTAAGTEAPASSPAPFGIGCDRVHARYSRAIPPIPAPISPPRCLSCPHRPPRRPRAPLQTAPTNVNVSVRIGSAGDNGPVTQVNVAAASSGAATTTNTSSPVATATSTPTGSPQPSPAVSSAATASTTPSQDDPGTWTWQWNCLSAPDLTAISPSGSAAGPLRRIGHGYGTVAVIQFSIKMQPRRSINRRT